MISLLLTLAHPILAKNSAGRSVEGPKRVPAGKAVAGSLCCPRKVGETVGAGPCQPPAWRLVSCYPPLPPPLPTLLPQPGQSASRGIKSRPSAHSTHSARQEAKRAPARLPLRGRSAGLHTLCCGLAQREARPMGKGCVQARIHHPVARAGCWVAELMCLSAKPEAVPSQGPVIALYQPRG